MTLVTRPMPAYQAALTEWICIRAAYGLPTRWIRTVIPFQLEQLEDAVVSGRKSRESASPDAPSLSPSPQDEWPHRRLRQDKRECLGFCPLCDVLVHHRGLLQRRACDQPTAITSVSDSEAGRPRSAPVVSAMRTRLSGRKWASWEAALCGTQSTGTLRCAESPTSTYYETRVSRSSSGR